MNVGPTEAIIALVIILVLFGGSQLPKLAKNLGKAQKEFKDGLDQGHAESESTEIRRDTNTSIAPTSTSTVDPAHRPVDPAHRDVPPGSTSSST